MSTPWGPSLWAAGNLRGVRTCALATDDGDEAGGHRYLCRGQRLMASTHTSKWLNLVN